MIEKNSIVDLLTSTIHVTCYNYPVVMLAPLHMLIYITLLAPSHILIYITLPHHISMSTTCHLEVYAKSVPHSNKKRRAGIRCVRMCLYHLLLKWPQIAFSFTDIQRNEWVVGIPSSCNSIQTLNGQRKYHSDFVQTQNPYHLPLNFYFISLSDFY